MFQCPAGLQPHLLRLTRTPICLHIHCLHIHCLHVHKSRYVRDVRLRRVPQRGRGSLPLPALLRPHRSATKQGIRRLQAQCSTMKSRARGCATAACPTPTSATSCPCRRGTRRSSARPGCAGAPPACVGHDHLAHMRAPLTLPHLGDVSVHASGAGGAAQARCAPASYSAEMRVHMQARWASACARAQALAPGPAGAAEHVVIRARLVPGAAAEPPGRHALPDHARGCGLTPPTQHASGLGHVRASSLLAAIG